MGAWARIQNECSWTKRPVFDESQVPNESVASQVAQDRFWIASHTRALVVDRRRSSGRPTRRMDPNLNLDNDNPRRSFVSWCEILEWILTTSEKNICVSEVYLLNFWIADSWTVALVSETKFKLSIATRSGSWVSCESWIKAFLHSFNNTFAASAELALNESVSILKLSGRYFSGVSVACNTALSPTLYISNPVRISGWGLL